MNYAEEFAYWYLRLNGFFTITNFVLHNKHGDTDILGIRPPNAAEFVNGKRLKEDDVLLALFGKSGCNIYRDYACIIAEVKGGKNPVSQKEIREKFDLETIKYALKRIGLFKLSEVDKAAEALNKAKYLTLENAFSTHKILFAHEDVFRSKEDGTFSFVSIEQMVKFIESRMGMDFKIQDWALFNSNLIQQMIHEAAIRKCKPR
jgi:hypothetical protein